MTDTHLTAATRFIEFDSDRFAYRRWDNPFAHLNAIKQPTLVLNGVDDIMVPSINSRHLAQNIPNAQLLIYPDAGHGAQFQYPERFLKHAIQFLEE